MRDLLSEFQKTVRFLQNVTLDSRQRLPDELDVVTVPKRSRSVVVTVRPVVDLPSGSVRVVVSVLTVVLFPLGCVVLSVTVSCSVRDPSAWWVVSRIVVWSVDGGMSGAGAGPKPARKWQPAAVRSRVNAAKWARFIGVTSGEIGRLGKSRGVIAELW